MTFVRESSEKTIQIIVTGREAHLIKLLRNYAYGKITIHKMNGQIVRIESMTQTLITEKDGLDLAKY